jgi:hypothetical protein
MSFRSLFTTIVIASVFLAGIAPECRAAAGTSQVATKGQAVQDRTTWQRGVVELLNDPRRGDAWSDWFSEWPSDVEQYEFRVENSAQLNEVIATFCKIQVARADAKQPPPPLEIRLSPLAEPSGYGWVSKFEKGNKLPAVFSLGNQQELELWYDNFIKPMNGRFGQMEFEKTPVAVPPTLTIFVGNEVVDLKKLRIPQGVHISIGDLPTLWHESNLIERKPKKSEVDVAAAEEAKLSEKERTALAAIRSFLKARTEQKTD